MNAAAQLSALADPTRRAVFEVVAGSGPQAVVDIARELPVSRPAVSQHLKVLADAGLVRSSSAGTRRLYAVDQTGLRELRQWLDGRWEAVLDRFEEAARERTHAMTVDSAIAPITKTRRVALPVAEAFDLFTTGMARWWPLETHSIAEADAVDLRFEPRVGGRLVEITRDGTEHSWADVLAWDPPNRFVLSWHPTVDPVAASRLEVRFRTAADGTEVVLEHSGWEEFGDRGAALRDQYDDGWEPVLERLAEVSRR